MIILFKKCGNVFAGYLQSTEFIAAKAFNAFIL